MKKKIILTLAMTAIMTQTALAADATTSASTTSKPATTATKTTTTAKSTSTAKSTTSTAKKTTAAKTTTATTTRSTVTPKTGDVKYVVVWGDTLNDIAAKYKTTAKAIADYNGIKDANKIYAGEVIYIPAPKTTTVTPTKPVVTTPVTPSKPVVTPVTPTVPVAPQQPVVDPTPVTPDAVTTPSITATADELKASLSKDGHWITTTTSDVTVDELLVEGTFYNKDDKTKDVYRKLGLYTQDENKKVTAEFALNVDKMTVKSPNFKIQNGTVNGDIYVNANGFVPACKVNGNIVFSSPEAFATADLSGMTLGEGFTVTFENPIDATTQPSITSDAKQLETAVSTKGRWIATTTQDVTVDGTLVVEGNFYNKDDYTKGLYRKLGLYTQDADKNVTGEFALNVGTLQVKSPNFKIQNGTVNGNVVVNAKGFTPVCTINGDVTFATQELMDSADLTGATINGNVTVAAK